MKSIKKFQDKKVENMSSIMGGKGKNITHSACTGHRDRYHPKTGLFESNSSWFRKSD